MTEYRYFADPHSSTASTWSDEAKICAICGERRPGYAGPFYGVEQVDFVCEACLIAGRLAERDQTANEGDVAALRDQLEGGPDADRLVAARTEELERRTPPLVSWQEVVWPAHCGDYCRFDGEVGLRELDELAPDGDGFAFFRAHVHEDIARDIDAADLLPAHAPPSRSQSNSPSVYLFRCLSCSRPVLWWDVD